MVAKVRPAEAGASVRWFVELLDVVGSQPIGATMRQCPSLGHGGDARPSLSISDRPGGGVRLHCFAGCTEQEILAALGLGVRQLYRPPAMSPRRYAEVARLKLSFPPLAQRRGHPASRGFWLEAVHRYGPADHDAGRVAEHLLLRWRAPTGGAKELLWETRLVGGGSVPGLLGAPERGLPLYREREVLLAVGAGEPVLVVESESSVDALRPWYATTWAGGAADVNVDRLCRVLGGYPQTLLVPDFDRAGLACARRLLAAGLGPAVLVGEPGEDARDVWRRLGRPDFARAVHHALRVASGERGRVVRAASGGPVAVVAFESLTSSIDKDVRRPARAAPRARAPKAGPSAGLGR